MLTYTFSTREKVLLAVLAFVAVIIAWYQLVFVNIQSQISDADAKIAAAQDEMVVFQSQVASLKTMKSTVEQYQDLGVAPIIMPNYDNTQPLMAFLNGVLAGKPGFTMSFEEPTVADDGTVHRVGTINYGTASYEEAREVAVNIAHGPYPCRIDSLAFADTSKAKSASNTGGTFSNAIQVTFFEKPTGNIGNKDGGSAEKKGQDLSKMKDWNK